jgi:Methionine biosynthesis protein MetW
LAKRKNNQSIIKLMERLNFQLPDFTRVCWVSDSAKSLWETRLARITNAWLEIEWRSVIAGVRECCLTSLTPSDLVAKSGEFAEYGLCALPLEMCGISQYSYSSTSLPIEPGKPFVFRTVIGKPESVWQFKQAFNTGDNLLIGKLLGFPDCCREFFQQVWVKQSCVDTSWQMACNTLKPTEITEDTRLIKVKGSPYNNILWRWMGIRLVPHLPCGFDCQHTTSFGKKLMQVGLSAGYEQEMDWLLQILNWSVEWSALHGIAEIKTPILKVSTMTDATPYKYTVQRQGETETDEGARGLNFPYQVPSKPLFTSSSAFRRGIENPISQLAEHPDKYAVNNGFSSRLVMDKAHQSIIEQAIAVLPNTSSTVIDLGCGNGALLKKIYEKNPTHIIPYGIEQEASRLENISLLLPQFVGNFWVGDIFASEELWAQNRRYSLALLMPGRLLEVSPETAANLKKRLQQQCDRILIYAYGDWLTRYGSLAGLAKEAGLELLNTKNIEATCGFAF